MSFCHNTNFHKLSTMRICVLWMHTSQYSQVKKNIQKYYLPSMKMLMYPIYASFFRLPGVVTQRLLNRWTSQLDLGCTTGWLERAVSLNNYITLMPRKSLMHHDIQKIISYHNFNYFFQYVTERNLNYFNYWQFLIFHSKTYNWVIRKSSFST